MYIKIYDRLIVSCNLTVWRTSQGIESGSSGTTNSRSRSGPGTCDVNVSHPELGILPNRYYNGGARYRYPRRAEMLFACLNKMFDLLLLLGSLRSYHDALPHQADTVFVERSGQTNSCRFRYNVV